MARVDDVVGKEGNRRQMTANIEVQQCRHVGVIASQLQSRAELENEVSFRSLPANINKSRTLEGLDTFCTSVFVDDHRMTTLI